MRGLAKSRLGKFQSAIQDFDRALNQFISNPVALELLKNRRGRKERRGRGRRGRPNYSDTNGFDIKW